MLLILAVAVPGAAAFAWVLAGSWQRAGDEARARVKLLADSTAARVAAELRDREAVFRRLAERPLVRRLDPAQCDPLIHEYIALHPEYSALGVRDVEANIVCAYRANAPPAAQVAAYPWFRQALAGGGFRVSAAFMGPAVGRWVFTLTYPVHDMQGRMAALLVLGVDVLEWQRRVIGSVPDGAIVAAADRDGKLVLRSHEPEKWLGKPAPSPYIDQARRAREGFLTGMGSDGISRLYAYATVPGADWIVAAGMPEAEVFAQPRALLARGVAIGLTVLALALLIAWRISRRVVEPIGALAEVAARVAHGDTRARAAVAGPAEIGEVAEHFNRMLDVRERADEERARAEAELARSQDRYRAIVDNALDAVVQMDAAGLITGWNARAETMFGWPASQAIGQRLHETIMPLRHREAHRRGVELVIAGGNGTVLDRVIEIEALHQDGREFPIELSVTAMPSGGEFEFSAFIRDISARKRAEGQRLALEAQLRESQKLEAIGTLAGGIAHDFNNILGAILGNLSLARGELPADHAANVALEQVHKAASRARSLVQQILAFSRREPQQLACRPLAPLVEETAAMLRATLPARVALDLALDDAPLYVRCDATQVQQVLMNLCTNAWHALDDGAGHIRIGLEPALLDEAAALPMGLPAGDYAMLRVQDDGCGMDDATRARIFDPFFTTKPVGQGTGLGLSVVHGIVTTHAGAIVVDSKPGRGSSFQVYMPRVAAEEVVAGAAKSSPAMSVGVDAHVLYIDDDEVMLMMVERLLVRAGYRVSGHCNPIEAVAAVRARPGAFDVVVTDFNMPGRSGLEVARDLSSLRKDLPVIVSSGMMTETLRMQAQQAGARAVLRKENTLEELVGLLQQVLAQAAAEPEAAPGAALQLLSRVTPGRAQAYTALRSAAIAS